MMTSFGDIGIGLSLVFGCVLLAFFAELYYLLRWKKSVSNSNTEIEEQVYYNSYAKELLYLLCLKTNTSTKTETENRNPKSHEEADIEIGLEKDVVVIRNNNNEEEEEEESVEAELMRIHNLSGPPRFLFTISEETREDLESEDGKSRTRSNLGDLMRIETPFLTPVPSPLNKSLDCYRFNPLFESSAEAELNRLKSSPLPKFKFLRDAEDKLLQRLLEEAEKRAIKIPVTNQSCVRKDHEAEPPNNNLSKERDQKHHNSQVLPLESSPVSTFRSPALHLP